MQPVLDWLNRNNTGPGDTATPFAPGEGQAIDPTTGLPINVPPALKGGLKDIGLRGLTLTRIIIIILGIVLIFGAIYTYKS